MRRGTVWLALVTALVLAAGCGGGDSGGDTPGTTTTTSAVTSSTTSGGNGTSATTTTEGSPTTLAAGTPYEQFLADPEAFVEANSHLIDDAIDTSDNYLGGRPDYVTAWDFEQEAMAQGLDLTGVEIWVWPVPDLDEKFLIFDFDTTATAFEEGDAGEELGMVMATSATLQDADITQVVITWQGADSDGPFSVTFMVPFDEVKTATLNGTDLDPDDVFAHFSREGS